MNSGIGSSRRSGSDANGYSAREDAQSLRCLMSNQSKPRGHQRGVSKSKMKTIKLTLAVVLCYLLCWAPWFIANMATAWNESIRFEGKGWSHRYFDRNYNRGSLGLADILWGK